MYTGFTGSFLLSGGGQKKLTHSKIFMAQKDSREFVSGCVVTPRPINIKTELRGLCHTAWRVLIFKVKSRRIKFWGKDWTDLAAVTLDWNDDHILLVIYRGETWAEGPNVSALRPGPDRHPTLGNHWHSIQTKRHRESKKHGPRAKSEVNSSRHRAKPDAEHRAGM